MDCIPNSPVLEFRQDTLDVVRSAFGLDKSAVAQSIDILEEWVKKQSHFRRKQFRRDYYERILISSKGSVEKSKSQIDKLCTLRTLLPHFFYFDDMDKKTPKLNELVCCVLLPKLTREHSRVYLIKVFNGSYYDSVDFIDYLKQNVMMAEYTKAHDYMTSFVFVGDYTDADLLEVMKKINLVELQQFVTLLIEAYGARVRQIHLVSQSKLIDLLIRAVKSVISPKIASRLNVHRDMEEVYKYVDKELFPADMGGQQKPLRELQDDWTKAILSEDHCLHLKEMAGARTDEWLRRVDRFNDQYAGVSGSFRTLTVD